MLVCEPRLRGRTMSFAFDIGRKLSDEQLKRRVAENQALLRRVNEAMRSHHADEVVAFRCECGQLRCNDLIRHTRDEYNAVRRHPRLPARVSSRQMLDIEA